MRYGWSAAFASRHAGLIELIPCGESSSPEFARELRVSETTTYRHIDFLKQRGYSIRSQRHTDGWAYHFLSEPATAPSGKGS